MEYWQKTEYPLEMYKRKLLFINAVLVAALALLSHHPLFGMVSKIDIQGIVLLGRSEDLIEEDYSSYEGIHHLGLKLPGNALTLERQLAELIGKEIDKETIAEIDLDNAINASGITVNITSGGALTSTGGGTNTLTAGQCTISAAA